jgi:hypothetical protein
VLLPRVTDRELGDTPIVKSAGGLTVSETVDVRLSAPLVPVIVSVAVPAGVFAAVVIVSVLVPDVVTVCGENPPVAFAGRPDTPRLTVPVNPLSAPTVTV